MQFRNSGFLLTQLVLRDFRIRYRNMSLGVFWSLANPLVMMSVLTFVFTRLNPERASTNFHLFILCGLVAFNFFSLGWSSGTTSLLTNAGLIKRVPMVREVIPVSTVLANGLHTLIQVGLLLLLVLFAGIRPTALWLWLPVILIMEGLFICGLSLITSAMDVYFRDTRYVVDSLNMILFWLIPVVYDQSWMPPEYFWIYWYNPVAAVVFTFRSILLEQRLELETVAKMSAVSLSVLTVGIVSFRALKKRFADYM